MAKARIFIDGEHGTTGLQIRERLGARDDIDLLSLSHADRHDKDKRAAMLNQADIAILCLPDEGARQAVKMLKAANNSTTRLIDASTAHRTDPDWVFGFAEMEPGQRDRIAAARFVSNPGCWSTGAIALLRPLILGGLLPADAPITLNGISGYSGGGKQMIAQMEDSQADGHIASHNFLYALPLKHKHVPEITQHAGLASAPIFTPHVGRFRQGMIVNLPLHLGLTDNADLAAIHQTYERHYQGQKIVEVRGLKETAILNRLDPEEMTGTDHMQLYVCGTTGSGQVNLVAILDNLGKGASGACVQNMDIMLAGATRS